MKASANKGKLLPLSEQFLSIRRQTDALVQTLSDADATVQSMEDASPAKWHLAHTSWFFETFLLKPYLPNYRVFSEPFAVLFNSYYEEIGARFSRPRRGMLTRPSLEGIFTYREHVNNAVVSLLTKTQNEASLVELTTLGLHHEQQHQELILTDILHLFAQSPLKPAFRESEPLPVEPLSHSPKKWVSFPGGTFSVGHHGDGFSFDCETPNHQILLQPFRLAPTSVTNGDWMDFIAGGGYETPSLWLSDGIAAVRNNGWGAPLYWEMRDGEWWSLTLKGFQPVDKYAPVCHVSFYEADAYATWANKRLPTEEEWEVAAAAQKIDGNFANSGRLRPKPQEPKHANDLAGLYGDVWEWTASAFTPYPGFKPAAGAVGEYNGKFMSGQMVLKGGSCATPLGHIRASYRNFFQPDKRWQFSGLRLAEDA